MNKHKHPIIYHGHNKKKNYFEGWYFKQISNDEKASICFIPGVSINKENPHAFIQCLYLNEKNQLTAYNINYPISEFKTNDSPFEVHIGNSSFSEEKIIIDIEDTGIIIKGEVDFGNFTPIQTSLIHPNIMGIFSYIPRMECNHGIISMNHTLNGNININDENINFANGKGYIEKDWGTSFPKEYVWIQSNHFKEDDASLFCSVANIPFMGSEFKGFICNFVYANKEYRFASYNGSKLKVNKVDNNCVDLTLRRKGLEMHITAEVSESRELFAPKNGLMNNVIKEGISGTVKVVLKDETGNIIFNSLGTSCGLELVSALKPIT